MTTDPTRRSGRPSAADDEQLIRVVRSAVAAGAAQEQRLVQRAVTGGMNALLRGRRRVGWRVLLVFGAAAYLIAATVFGTTGRGGMASISLAGIVMLVLRQVLREGEGRERQG